ncbi:hypothetical protein GUJ93_ZPchr0011g27912 [Zizania palustris]|uniref:Uncharacterized protein n=1 Tax=Zizania palustris TaxID=103762 RepID=A0A8J5WHT7_ZIZPA|nr:hypothetical protein GUJ93_ZPchr0011g27912 [Zizania palustris]
MVVKKQGGGDCGAGCAGLAVRRREWSPNLATCSPPTNGSGRLPSPTTGSSRLPPVAIGSGRLASPAVGTGCLALSRRRFGAS